MTAARTLVRLGAGVVITLATTAVVAGGILVGAGTHSADPAPITVAPAAADTVLTCPGPLLALGRNAKEAGGLSVAAPAHVTVGASQSTVTQQRLGLASVGGGGPIRLTAAADGHTTMPHAVGAASATVSASDLSGFAAAACTPALMQSWLVGGATDSGSSDLILLANPGAAAATVDLTLYGSTGMTTPAAGSGVIVAPGSQVVVPLAALGLGQGAPVVLVTSSGAPVRAALQTNITRTLTPGGVDQSGPIAAAAPTQVITGVRVDPTTSTDQATTVLRLLAPHTSTSATVTVAGAHGTVGAARHLTVPAGQPVEIALPGLPAGMYTVTVTAQHPVVAAVWQAQGTSAGDDFAWVESAPVLPASPGGTLFAVPQGPGAALAVTATGASAVHARVDGTTVTVAAGTTASIPVSADATHRLTVDAPAAAAVTLDGPDALASSPVWPQDVASGAVSVYR